MQVQHSKHRCAYKIFIVIFFHATPARELLLFTKIKLFLSHNTTSSRVKGRALHTNGGTFYVPFDNENGACVFVVCQCCPITYASSPTTILQLPPVYTFFWSLLSLFLLRSFSFSAPDINQLNLHHVRAYTTHILQD